MNSNWARESWSVFVKEWMTEMRSKHGLFTSFLFSILAVVAMAFASFGTVPPPNLAAGILCVTLLFSAVVSLPRTFISEDELGTFDLLLIATEPTAAYAGKYLYNVIQSVISTSILATLFVSFNSISVTHYGIFSLCCLLTSLSLAGGVSVCGALVIGATNRWILGSTVALPILLPQIFLGIGAFKVSFGSGSVDGAWKYLVGLAGWAIVLAASGPLLAANAWKSES